MNSDDYIRQLLKGREVIKEYFDELKYVAKITNRDGRILQWFLYLQSIETTGWRSKAITTKICSILSNDEPVQFYALFCPSYKKGTDAVGFRTDDVGKTSKNGLQALSDITEDTRRLGFRCIDPEAIFFVLVLEQPEKTMGMLDDLEINIENFKKYVPNNMSFSRLSEKFPELIDIIGVCGITTNPLPIEDKIFNRIIERGEKFYQHFGWSKDMIIERSKIIASSEAIVGAMLRQRMINGIMVYTPTMLERSQIYSGRQQKDPIAMIFPKK